MSAYFIRQMQETDQAEVSEFVYEAGDFPWSTEHIRQSLVANHDTSYVLCNKDSNQLIGYTVVHDVLYESQLLNIVIKKNWQGRGLGKFLLQQLINVKRQQGQVRFLLEVRLSNKIARKLYENLGFNCDGKRKAYYPAEQGREDACLYSLVLN